MAENAEDRPGMAMEDAIFQAYACSEDGSCPGLKTSLHRSKLKSAACSAMLKNLLHNVATIAIVINAIRNSVLSVLVVDACGACGRSAK